jgi:exopolysaccharide biosynthesis polyprenyl glycosylphosphotransferase
LTNDQALSAANRAARTAPSFSRPRQLELPTSDNVGTTEDTRHEIAGEVGGDTTRMEPRQLRLGLVMADCLGIMAGFVLTYVFLTLFWPRALMGEGFQQVLVAALLGPAWLAALYANKLYLSRTTERGGEELRRLLAAGAIGVSAMLAIAFALRYDELSRGWIGTLFVMVTMALIVERRLARRVFAKLRRTRAITRRVAVIGTDAHAISLLHTTQRNPALGYDVVGFIGDEDLGQRGGKSVLGGVDRAVELLREHGCTGALISLNSVNPESVNRLTRTLTDEGFHVALSTSLCDIDITRMRAQTLGGETLIYVEPTIRSGWRSHAKRLFDLGVAGAGLLITGPVIALAAVLIRAESEGPVFFRQERVGRDGRRFEIIKLRTMYLDAEERKAELMAQNEMDGPLFKMEHDPRITRVGRVLRKLSIDEFPQFWNVIRGEMSVVGPRPALPDEVEQWDPVLHDRLRVPPGITGMWQVSGRSGTSFDEYKRLDLYYVDNWSLSHDVRIVSKTFGAVLLQRGAS